VKWQPGSKLKIGIGDSETRTYTPIAIDAHSGRVRILAYIHGDGLASQWAATVAVGDQSMLRLPESISHCQSNAKLNIWSKPIGHQKRPSRIEEYRRFN
jgi:hypothetical protein